MSKSGKIEFTGVTVVSIASWTAALILLCAKLFGTANVSWLIVIFPIFIPAILGLVTLVGFFGIYAILSFIWLILYGFFYCLDCMVKFFVRKFNR